MARQKDFRYSIDGSVLSVFASGSDDSATALRSYDAKDYSEEIKLALVPEGMKKLMSQESATDGGSDADSRLASFDATHGRLIGGELKKETTRGPREYVDQIFVAAVVASGIDSDGLGTFRKSVTSKGFTTKAQVTERVQAILEKYPDLASAYNSISSTDDSGSDL